MDPRHRRALAEAKARQSDQQRPEAVDWVHTAGRLTATERLDLLLDPDSGVSFGSIAARDASGGWVPEAGGIDVVGTIDGQTVIASSTDFTDKGGGYGAARLERLFALGHEHRWPVVFFVDGGGSRARHPRTGEGHRELNGPFGRFQLFDGIAELSGWVPTVAIVSGPAFAGHASLAGFSDCVIATSGSSIGMGGPPMVEAALGMTLSAGELAGVEMHDKTGGIDVLCDNEPEAISIARRYLSYWRPPGSMTKAEIVDPDRTDTGVLAPDPHPDGSGYDMLELLTTIVDGGSFLELRPQFARSVITAFARIGGRSVGILASRPSVDAGWIADDAAIKAQRFVELCDCYELPILAMIDTRGAVVNRWSMRAVMAHHHRTVPLFAVQTGRGDGLGPAVLGGLASGRSVPVAWWAWPSTDFGDTGTRDVDDFSQLRSTTAFDDVIDPDETRQRIIRLLVHLPRAPARSHKKHPIDTW